LLERSEPASAGDIGADPSPKTKTQPQGWVPLNHSTSSIANQAPESALFHNFLFPLECCDYSLLLRFAILTSKFYTVTKVTPDGGKCCQLLSQFTSGLGNCHHDDGFSRRRDLLSTTSASPSPSNEQRMPRRAEALLVMTTSAKHCENQPDALTCSQKNPDNRPLKLSSVRAQLLTLLLLSLMLSACSGCSLFGIAADKFSGPEKHPPAFAGYANRLLAQSWESNNLYFAGLADEAGIPVRQLDAYIPEWNRSAIENIFATHLEDWPAILRSLQTVGREVRERQNVSALMIKSENQ